MTLGYGVSDDQTWCHQLELRDRRLESINMGQAGYGIQQDYLRYKRDAAALVLNVHLFAFIDNDFDRFQDSPAPIVRIEGDKLVVTNVPVRKQFFQPATLNALAEATRSLRVFQLWPVADWSFVGRTEPWRAKRC
jgi:hypothetical protein